MTHSLQHHAEILQDRYALKLAARLSAGAQELPHDLSERLRVARLQAVSHRKVARVTRARLASHASSNGSTATLSFGDEGWNLWSRLASALPLLTLVVGLVTINVVQNDNRADESCRSRCRPADRRSAARGLTNSGFIQFLQRPATLPRPVTQGRQRPMSTASCSQAYCCGAVATASGTIPGASAATRASLSGATLPPKAAVATSSPAQRAGSPQPLPPKAWGELSAAEQKALKPLAANWNSIDEARKRKWLAISKNFNTLSPTEQATLHSRMSEWVALSPKQRTQARLNFAERPSSTRRKACKVGGLSSSDPEEKNKLAASATPRPPGAATAVKPVPPQKLATPVDAKPPRGGASGVASGTKQLDQKTLLPRKPASPP